MGDEFNRAPKRGASDISHEGVREVIAPESLSRWLSAVYCPHGSHKGRRHRAKYGAIRQQTPVALSMHGHHTAWPTKNRSDNCTKSYKK